MPNGRFDVIRELVSKTAVTERAGFASLYNALDDAIPERGNFLEWLENGWKLLSEALGGQKVTMHHVVGDGNRTSPEQYYRQQWLARCSYNSVRYSGFHSWPNYSPLIEYIFEVMMNVFSKVFY